MIELDYRIEPGDRSAERNLSTADVHYGLLCGDVIFLVGDWDASHVGSWEPVLDFAICLRSVVAALGDDPIGSNTFEFTESDETIVFQRVGDIVELSANYAEGTALVPLSELQAAVDDFAWRVLTELVAAYPALASNPEVLRQLRWPA